MYCQNHSFIGVLKNSCLKKENTCDEAFLVNLQAEACGITKKWTSMQEFTGEFYKTFLSCFLTKHVRATTNYILESVSYTGIRRVIYITVMVAISVINVISVNPISCVHIMVKHKCV